MSPRSAAALCNDQTHLHHSIGLKEMEARTEIGKAHSFQSTTSRNARWTEEMSLHHCSCHSRSSACTSLWIIADKILGCPAEDPLLPSPLLFPKSPSHHIIQKPLGGLRAWRAHAFLISYLSLLGANLWGNRADLSASTVWISTPIRCNCSIALHRSSCTNFSFYFLYDHWITGNATFTNNPRWHNVGEQVCSNVFELRPVANI